jgi:hypothetical protein
MPTRSSRMSAGAESTLGGPIVYGEVPMRSRQVLDGCCGRASSPTLPDDACLALDLDHAAAEALGWRSRQPAGGHGAHCGPWRQDRSGVDLWTRLKALATKAMRIRSLWARTSYDRCSMLARFQPVRYRQEPRLLPDRHRIVAWPVHTTRWAEVKPARAEIGRSPSGVLQTLSATEKRSDTPRAAGLADTASSVRQSGSVLPVLSRRTGVVDQNGSRSSGRNRSVHSAGVPDQTIRRPTGQAPGLRISPTSRPLVVKRGCTWLRCLHPVRRRTPKQVAHVLDYGHSTYGMDPRCGTGHRSSTRVSCSPRLSHSDLNRRLGVGGQI